MKRFINRIAWKIVRATASPAPHRPVCIHCNKRHRTQAAAARCESRSLAIYFGPIGR